MTRLRRLLRRAGTTSALWIAIGIMVGMAAPARAAGDETVQQAVCRLIEGAAAQHHLSVDFLTHIIWQESSFRPNVTSPAGAQGIAQFMPGTARERGLDDPFDPEQAIPASASLLADLTARFGNIGLAAAAYNAGPARVTAWMRGGGSLPFETVDYVLRVTGRPAEDWLAVRGKDEAPPATAATCIQLASTLRQTPAGVARPEAPFAPWGVQLAGNFSKSLALASFSRARTRYQTVVGDIRPMVIGTRLRTRGFRAFYRVRIPAASREAANNLCSKIHNLKGACIVLRS